MTHSFPTRRASDLVVSYTKPFLAKGDAPRWRVRYVDPDGTLTLALLGGRRGRSTARFGVDPGKVTIRNRAGQEPGVPPPKAQGTVLAQRYVGPGRFKEEPGELQAPKNVG